MDGRRAEDGTINLGPSVFGDDRISHPTYASYAEYSYATGEMKGLEEDGLSKDQQICFATVAVDNLPSDLARRLNGYARNEISLMESEYTELMDELEPFLDDVAFLRSVSKDFKDKCTVV